MLVRALSGNGGGGGVSDTEWMQWQFGNAYTDSSSNYFLAMFVKGYSTLKIYQTTYQASEASREVSVYAGYDMSNATYLGSYCHNKDEIYTVDISSYDYIILKRTYPRNGTETYGYYQLLV